MWNLIITNKEYSETLRELLELEIWYAEHAAAKENRPLRDTINQYTEIYYYSTEFEPDILAEKNVAWQKVVDDIAQNSSKAWDILAPYIVPRIEQDLQKSRSDIEKSYNGFMYEFCPEYESDSNEDFLTLHFRNYFAPESPFAHGTELKQGLRKIVKCAMQERPDVKQVQCASWLNNVPKFISLFPKEWLERANFCYPMTASTGWWGRFIDRNGKLNQKTVSEFKKHPVFDAPNRHCRCTVNELYVFLAT